MCSGSSAAALTASCPLAVAAIGAPQIVQNLLSAASTAPQDRQCVTAFSLVSDPCAGTSSANFTVCSGSSAAAVTTSCPLAVAATGAPQAVQNLSSAASTAPQDGQCVTAFSLASGPCAGTSSASFTVCSGSSAAVVTTSCPLAIAATGVPQAIQNLSSAASGAPQVWQYARVLPLAAGSFADAVSCSGPLVCTFSKGASFSCTGSVSGSCNLTIFKGSSAAGDVSSGTDGCFFSAFSSSTGASTGVPQAVQKASPLAIGAPQCRQTGCFFFSASTGLPQNSQNLLLSGMAAPQLVHCLLIMLTSST